MKKLLLLICCFSYTYIFSQSQPVLSWWNPAQHEFQVVEGQAWPEEAQDPYDRLPARAEKIVSSPVWGLSKHGAGLMIRFRSSSKQILVRYTVAGDQAMNHMPATGVSGVDLYAIGSDGNMMWAKANRSFGDTIVYHYQGLSPHDAYHKQGREYRLYLPLYNQVKWLEIGIEEEAFFNPLPVRKEKPIVVYGTSIAQGACTSRPGMAWTSILGRKLDRPLLNLAFSGNGRLEKELIDLLVEIDPKIYILDCLPNLMNAQTYSEEDLTQRIMYAVRVLKEKRPEVPVLLVEHGGYTDGLIIPARQTSFTRVNQIQAKAFARLKREGHRGIFYMTKEEIGLQLEDMVDGTHPNDLGMMHYAEGYEKKLRFILKEPIGKSSTTHPITQYREPNNYDWEERHNDILEMNVADPPQTVFIANSIIHFWGGLPRTKLVREEASWKDFLTPRGVRNLAYGWDRIENVLWRVYHGELDGFEAKQVLVMIGTNNLHLNSDAEILEGLELLMKAIQARQPQARITLMGLLPRRKYEPRIEKLNESIAQLAGDTQLAFADLGAIFLQEDGEIQESLFSDGLHPNAAGYVKLRAALLPLIKGKK